MPSSILRSSSTQTQPIGFKALGETSNPELLAKFLNGVFFDTTSKDHKKLRLFLREALPALQDKPTNPINLVAKETYFRKGLYKLTLKVFRPASGDENKFDAQLVIAVEKQGSKKGERIDFDKLQFLPSDIRTIQSCNFQIVIIDDSGLRLAESPIFKLESSNFAAVALCKLKFLNDRDVTLTHGKIVRKQLNNETIITLCLANKK